MPGLRLAVLVATATSVAVAVAVPGSASAAATGGEPTGRTSYVVQLRDGVDARGVARAVQAQTTHVYSAALSGFAARLTDGQVRQLRSRGDVVTVEADGVVRADTPRRRRRGAWTGSTSGRARSTAGTPSGPPAPASPRT